MTLRRDVLKAVLSAATPFPSVESLPAVKAEGRGLIDLILDHRRLDRRMQRLTDMQDRAERSASARGVCWDDCSKVSAARAAQKENFRLMDALVMRAARGEAARLDDVVLKLFLWRHADPEPRGFHNPWDMLPFSAYRDLLALTGREALAHPADEAARAAMEN